MTTTTSSSESAAIVVAGDICLDVLGYPIPPSPKNQNSPEENWRQSGETRTFYRRGGAWLLADFLKAALKAANRSGAVVEPVAPETTEFERLTRQEIVHSLLGLNVFTDKVKNKDDCVCEMRRIRVARTHGFSGPDKSTDASQPNYPTLNLELRGDVAHADLVILDDTGNRFRHQRELWPLAITAPPVDATARPLVLYKVHRPLPTPEFLNADLTPIGDELELWPTIRLVHGNNTVVVASVDDLRDAGAVISRRLSWERTALELVWQLNGGAGSDRLAELRRCPHLIVRLGLEGVVYWCNPGTKQSPRAWLVYDPTAIEGDWDDQLAGTMVGFGSAFIAGLAATLLAPETQSELQALRVGSCLAAASLTTPDSVLNDYLPQLERALKRGLLASRHLLSLGYGEPRNDREPDPRYPIDSIFTAFTDRDEAQFATIQIPISSDLLDPDPIRWSILNTRLPGGSDLDTAAEALATLKKPTEHPQVGAKLAATPRGVFGKLTTYDRNEIEAYRAVSNVVREYLGQLAPKRPLCLAVFGPPGSGKSFGVEQVAISLAERTGAKIAKLTFNLSQLRDVDDLNRSLHLVRDAVLKGGVPLVFFDEFDSTAGGDKLFWLKLLLAPMQDGEFLDQGAIHPLGGAIFVFAGGTASRYAAFTPSQYETDGKKNPLWQDFIDAKGPDFISRLRGVIDIPGIEIDPAQHRAATVLRRAGILRFQLSEKTSHLFDVNGRLQIDEGVLRAFLQVRRFHHGIRSLEAILDMSQLANRSRFDAGSLPHPSQLALHVEPQANAPTPVAGFSFVDLVHRASPFLHDRRERIAQEIHAHYLEERNKPGGGYDADKASHQDWENLNEFYRDSNRAQADDIPRKLRLIGYRYAEATGISGLTELPLEAIDKLAKPEHDRWLAERRSQSWTHGDPEDTVRKIHPAMLEWDQLPDEQKAKDRASILAIPRYLQAGGYIVAK